MTNNIKNLEELKAKIINDGIFKFRIKVVANSKNNSIEFLDDYIKIKIKEKAINGEANKGIIGYLSNVLNIPKSKIELVNGIKSSNKTIQVNY